MIARYMKSKYKNVAALYDTGDDYSTGLYETFVDECGKLGLNIIATKPPHLKTWFLGSAHQHKNAIRKPYSCLITAHPLHIY